MFEIFTFSKYYFKKAGAIYIHLSTRTAARRYCRISFFLTFWATVLVLMVMKWCKILVSEFYWWLDSHLSGCFWLFAPKFWEVVGTYEWYFCSFMNAAWVLGTIRGGEDTQTLLAVWRKLWTSCTQRYWGCKSLVMCAQQASWWNFHTLIFWKFVYSFDIHVCMIAVPKIPVCLVTTQMGNL